MKIQIRSMPRLVALIVVFLHGCQHLGRVNQGQVIDYDPQNGIVTLIQDSNYAEPGKPRFDVLPPLAIRAPVNPKEMGQAPEAGKLLDVNTRDRKIVIYDASTRTLRTFDYEPIEQRENVAKDDPSVTGAHFPVVDREKAIATLYSPRHRSLVTLRIPRECLALADDAWKVGDVVRYYYKDPEQALRMMNVTKTDVKTRG